MFDLKQANSLGGTMQTSAIHKTLTKYLNFVTFVSV